ncbi:MAG: type II CAAX endopeptidase family protein [Clostridia bacterium]|nr:type II CAAX endopeptidase family protein [Clostridia bacterium]
MSRIEIRPYIYGNRNVFDKFDALFLFGIAILAYQITGTIAVLVAPDYEFVSILITQLTMFFTVYIYAKARGIRFENATRFNAPFTWYNIPLMIVLALGLIFFMIPIDSWFTTLLESLNIHVYSGETDLGSTTATQLIMLFAYSFGPAFGEEFLMRGGIANGLSNSMGKWKAIFLSAALFSLMHTNPGQLIHPFVMGVVLAYVMFTTGSIWAASIIHFVNNFTVVAIELWFLDDFNAFYEKNYIWMMIVGLVVAVGVLVLVTLLERKKSARYAVVEDKQEEIVVDEEAQKLIAIQYEVANRTRRILARVLFYISVGICVITFVAVAAGFMDTVV